MTKRTQLSDGTVHHLEGAVTCPKCHVVNRHGSHFCIECGLPLGAPPLHVMSEDVVDARRRATRELRRGYKKIGVITWLYRLGALGYAGVTLVAVLALARTDVPRGAGVLVVALTSVLTVTMLMGAIQVLFRPFVWTVVIASLATVVAVAHLVGPNPLGLAALWSGTWALLFWISFGPSLELRRLIAEHTDLYITHHASRSTKRSLEGRSAKERHQRLMRAMQRASRRAWKVSIAAGGAIALASALGAHLVLAHLRPQLLSDAVSAFEVTWNDEGIAAVGRLLPVEVREREAERLAGVIEGHGWGSSPPKLIGGDTRREESRAWIDYDLGGVALSTRWSLRGQTWSLTRVELPIPPFEPVFERFLEAWRSSDPGAIAALYPAAHRERMRKSIQGLADRRDWGTFPTILASEVGEVMEDEVEATLTVESGDVSTGWLFRGDGKWSLHTLHFPSP